MPGACSMLLDIVELPMVYSLDASTGHKGIKAMESSEREGTDEPKTIETVKIEWNWDFDDLWHEIKSVGSGESETHAGKGRSLQAERALYTLLGRTCR